MTTVQIGVLVQDTGEKPRTLQHWSDLGILRPEPGTDKKGRGTYRVYRAGPLGGERTWALLASAYAKLRLPLGDIRSLIYGDRLSHDPIDLLEHHASPTHIEHAIRIRAEREETRKQFPGFIEPFEAAVGGEPNIFAVTAVRPHDPISPYRTCFLRQPIESKWTDGDGAVRANNKMLLNLMADNTTAMVINLSKIFTPLRRDLFEEHGQKNR